MERGAYFYAVAALTLLPASLPGQERSATPLFLPSGARARLSTTTFAGTLEGFVVRNDAESVTVLRRGGGEQVVAASSITRLEISVAKKRQTLKGALFGIAAGAALGFLVPVDPQDCGAESENACSRGAAVGAAAG